MNRVSLAEEVYLKLEKDKENHTNITVSGDCISILFGSSFEQLRTETGESAVSYKLTYLSIGLKKPLTSTPCTGRVLQSRPDRLYVGSAKLLTFSSIKKAK